MLAIHETAYPRLRSSYSEEELRVHYTPSEKEVTLAYHYCQQDAMRIGLLTLLKTFQHLGYFLKWNDIPVTISRHIGCCLGFLFIPDVPTSYEESGSRYRHMRLIRKYLNVQPLRKTTYICMQEAAQRAAQTKEHLADIVNIMLEELIKERYELPAFSRLVREAASARAWVNAYCITTIHNALSEDQKQLIDELLSNPSDEPISWWQQIKQEPPAPTVKNVRRFCEHVAFLRSHYQPLSVLVDLPPAKRKQFAYEAYTLDLPHLRQCATNKRYAFVVLLLEKQMGQALDDLVLMFIRRMAKLHQDGKALLEAYHAQSRERVAELIGYLANITSAYQTEGTAAERFQAITEAMPEEPDKIHDQCRRHLAYAENNYLLCLPQLYLSKRSLLFECVAFLPLQSSSQDQSLMDAVSFILQHRHSRKEWLPIMNSKLNLSWLPDKWHQLVIDSGHKTVQTEQVHRKYFELCVFTELIKQIKSGDIYIEGSIDFDDYRKHLIGWNTYYDEVMDYESISGIPTEAHRLIEKLQEALAQRIQQIDEAFPYNQYARLEDNKLVLSHPTKSPLHHHYDAIDEQLKARMVPLNILEVLVHTEKWLRLSRLFHTLSGKGTKVSAYDDRLVTTLFCYGCLMGPTQTARSVRGANRKQLAWVNTHHVTEERLDRAITKVINAYNRFLLPKYWGTGKSASADGTKWDVYEQNLLSEYHIRYGGYGGIGYYHVSDTYIALFSHFIPCGVYEAVYILDGLLKNTSDIQPDTVHGDTHAQSTVVFGLAFLLGIQLMPRIRNIKDLTFFRPDKTVRYQYIDSLFSESIQWELIQKHLPDMLRVVLSIKLGKIAPSTILRRLGADSRKNKLYFAFRELGRVIRTLFLLDYMHDENLRSTIQAATNKSEEFNQFADWLAFASKVIPENLRHEQTKIIKYNHLVANLVILYNVDEMTRVLDELLQEGYPIDEELLQAFSPYRTEHINRFGSYTLDSDRKVSPLNYNIKLI